MRPTLLCLCLLAALAVTTTGDALATVFVVDDVADPLPITGTMTLRQAILAANAAGPGPHTIQFQIPTAPCVIRPTAELPAITRDQVMIDGFSQPGASPGANPPATAVLLIEIDGSLAGAAHGLIVLSSYNTIQGLVIRNFERDGIRILGTPTGTYANTVWANFVGTDVTGRVAAGNAGGAGNIWAGIDILCFPPPTAGDCAVSVIQQNLVSGNLRCGVQIRSALSSNCRDHQVRDNYIGTDITGMSPLGNAGSGVVLAGGTHDNIISSNIISANGADGVDLIGDAATTPPLNTTHNHLGNNLIGLGADEVQPLGNAGRGVSIGIFEISSLYGGFCTDNECMMNRVAHNGMSGFSVWEHPLNDTNADRNAIVENSTFANAGLGIDLGDNGPTPNDPGDLDTGADQELNYPVILTADWLSGATTLMGTADPASEVHVFRAQVEPLGDAEGISWLGSVWPRPTGTWSLTVSGLSVGDFVTATGHDWAGGTGTYTNSSEFAAPLIVQLNPSGVADGSVRPGFRLALAGPNPFRRDAAFSYELPAPDHATLRVYDARGELIRTLVDDLVDAGPHHAGWDGTTGNGSPAAVGVYFVALDAGGRKGQLRIVKVE